MSPVYSSIFLSSSFFFPLEMIVGNHTPTPKMWVGVLLLQCIFLGDWQSSVEGSVTNSAADFLGSLQPPDPKEFRLKSDWVHSLPYDIDQILLLAVCTTRTRTRTHARTHTHTHTLSLSLSHTQTHTHIHTQTHTQTIHASHTHTHGHVTDCDTASFEIFRSA